MQFRYGKWRGGPFDDPKFLKALLDLYQQLLLQLNGDVEIGRASCRERVSIRV